MAALLPYVLGGWVASTENNSQLTSEQRYQIIALLQKNHKQTDFENILGVGESTISSEIRRDALQPN